MPTILWINNIRFYFFSLEGPRPHIHVRVNEFELQAWLDDLTIKKSSMNRAIDKKLMVLIKRNRQYLLEAWHEHFKK